MRIAIIGVGQTKLRQDRAADTFADLVYEAATRCLEDAGISIKDVGNIVTVSNDFLDGRTISSMAVGDAAGAAFGEGKNISTVEGDGTFGAFYGMSRILSGAYPNTLVVAHSKASEGDPKLISNAWFDPIYERSLGLDAYTAAALQARVVMEKRGLTDKDLAGVVVRNRAAGAKNPNAQQTAPLTLQEVLDSPPLASPLRAADISPLSDGAAAILLAGEDFARAHCKNPVWVEGAAYSADPKLTDRDLGIAKALREAAAGACRMAGLEGLKGNVDAVELDESFSYQQPLWLSELGLETLAPERINPSGGSACGRPEVPAGLLRMIEAARQLRGGAKRVLAHGQSGPCAQSHCVWLLGKN